MCATHRTLLAVTLLLSVLILQVQAARPDANGPIPEFIEAQGTTYHVAPTGSDGAPGTAAQPWQTIQHAANTMVAGDTVYIRAGTYTERVVPQNSGSTGSWITYTAYPGEIVTIDGSSIVLPDDLAGLFHVSNQSYITVSGLRVIHAGPNDNNAGILVLDSSYIQIEHNETYDTNSSGIGVWGSDHVIVYGNRVEEAGGGGWQECISIAGTTLFDVRDNEVLYCHKEGICIKDGASHGQVHGSHVHHTQRVGIYVDAWDKYTHDISVFRNVVHDVSEGDAFAVASEQGGLLQNVYLHNNLAYHNRYIGFSVTTNGMGGPMNGIHIVNNTAYNNGWAVWGGGIAVDNPSAQNVVVRNNIVSQNLYFQIAVSSLVPTGNYSIDHNLIDGYRDHGEEGETRGTDFVEGDPLFLNASGADFHLLGSSPAVDQGSAVGAPADDYDGHIRPQDGDENGVAEFDIGAYEVQVYSEHVYLPCIHKGQ